MRSSLVPRRSLGAVRGLFVFGPQGIHVAHIVVDGQIDSPRVRQMSPDREDHTMLSPDAIAQTYWQLHQQHPSAWTLELDLRPSVESS